MSSNHTRVTALTECSVMLSLSVVLSFVQIWHMPMGGEVTLFSMLPVALISVKYGVRKGLSTAFLFGLFHLLRGLASGEVFVYCATALAVVICTLFDYIFPFSALGLSGLFRKKGTPGICAGILLSVFLRFSCHFVTGAVIWAQFAPEGQSKYLYSLLYNGQYMLPEGVMTVLGAAALTRLDRVRSLLKITETDAKQKQKNI